MNDYEFLEKLGSGSYSTVYKGIHKVRFLLDKSADPLINYTIYSKVSKEIYAIKCVEKQKLSKAAIDNIITEIGLLKALNHKHIVEMKEFQWDSK